MASAVKPAERITSLDGVRGVAAMVVLVHHTMLVMPSLAAPYYQAHATSSVTWLIYSPVHIFWAGGEAVFVFFVLSGFALTYPVVTRPKFDWLAYYPARLVRLYIPVIASVIIAAVFLLAVPRIGMTSTSRWMLNHVEALTPRGFFGDATLTAPDLMNSPLWSLKWEVLFSLALPLYVWIAFTLRRQWWLVLAASLTLGAVGVALGSRPLTYLPIFMLGCVVAVRLDDLLALRAWLERVPLGRVACWIALLVAVLAVTSTWTTATYNTSLASAFTPLVLAGALLFVLLAIVWPHGATALKARPVQWLGSISFSLYLVHEPIVVSIGILMPRQDIGLVPVVAIPLGLLAGWLFWRFVEKPSHRLAKLLSARVTAATQVRRERIAAGA